MWQKRPEGEKQDWPYTQYSEANGFVTLSGQTALKDGVPVSGGIEKQTRQAIDNCMSIMHRLGMDERNIMHVRVVLLHLDEDRGGFEAIYDYELFPDPKTRASRDLIGAQPANGSLIDIEMFLSRTPPQRGEPGEPETDDAGQVR